MDTLIAVDAKGNRYLFWRADLRHLQPARKPRRRAEPEGGVDPYDYHREARDDDRRRGLGGSIWD